MAATIVGLLVVIIAGICNASFAGPMKKMPKWAWENQWGMWAVWALLVTAWSFALLTVPNLFGVLGETRPQIRWMTFLLGAGGGVGMVTFGFGIYLVGFSLGFSIILGLTAATGSLIPMLIHHPQALTSPSGLVTLLGLAVTVAGVGLCGKAGMIRESAEGTAVEASRNRGKFLTGLMVCIASAIFNAMINLSFTAGAPIAEAALPHVQGGAAHFRATNAVWALSMTGAFIPNALYCGYLLVTRKTWRNFGLRGTGHYWLLTLVMGVVWMSGYALYGASTALLGTMGTTVGWIIFFAMTVLTGNVMGFMTGEWKTAPERAVRLMHVSILVLIAAIVIVGLGGALSG